MKLTLKRTGTFSLPDGTLKDDTRRLVVWWYGPVIKNNQANSVPKVYVFFRILDDQNSFGDFVRREAALTHLGLLRIGSVWHKGVSNNDVVYKEEKFDVDFSEGGWRVLSLRDLESCGKSLYTEFLRSPYLPEGRGRETFLIDFYLPGGKHLFVPCLEFFVRCYGSSSEVKRVLSTYPWEKVKERLFKPLDTPASPGTWPVKFTRRVHNDDAILLAHILYDPYAEIAAKRIYAQLEADFSAGHPYSLPKITPWFQGAGQLLVEGVPIEGGKSFLALRVLGSTQPGGATIHREKEQRVATAAGKENDGAIGLPAKGKPGAADIIDLTDDAEPDHGSSWLDVAEEKLVILGERRKVIEKWRDRDGSSLTRNIHTPGDEASFSTGEAYGLGKGVGKAHLYASLEMESQGMLRDMWVAFRYLYSLYPNRIKNVEWFTFEGGFCSDSEPKLIRMNPITDDTSVTTSVEQWPFIDYEKNQPRGVLVIRVRSEEKLVYIVEIQRRSKIKPKELNVFEEESISGLCFCLDDDASFEQWIRKLLSEIRYKKGIFKKILGRCPGIAKTFSHRTSKSDAVLCESVAKNALRKMGLEV